MGEVVPLTGGDGSAVQTWREPAQEARRGGLVVLPDVSGVTPHLRALAVVWAGEGWEVLILPLSDPLDPLDPGATETDTALVVAVQAAVDSLRPAGPVCVIGFGFGGAAAWLAACRCEGVDAAAVFDGGRIAAFVQETPLAPVLLHFGRHDAMIPPAGVERIREAHPDVPIHVYDAGRAFFAPNGSAPDSARLAMLRTRAFFHRAIGGREHGA